MRSSGVQGVRGVQEENGRIGVLGVGRARLPPALGVSRRVALFDGKEICYASTPVEPLTRRCNYIRVA